MKKLYMYVPAPAGPEDVRMGRPGDKGGGNFHTALESRAEGVLSRVNAFKTLDGLAADLHRELGPDAAPEMKRLLTRFAAQGKLVPLEEIPSRLRAYGNAAGQPPPITSIGFVTRDRQKSLERALLSYIGNTKEHGRKTEFAVMDDTPDPARRRECRARLKELGRRSGIKLSYGGYEEKKRFADALTGKGLPREVVNFALFDTEGCGRTFGANRNALILHSAGDLFLSADDDTLCRIALPPRMRTSVRFACASNAEEFWFFGGRRDVLRYERFTDTDFLAVHEKVLGRTIGELLRRPGAGPGGLAGMAPDELRRLLARGGSVAATITGHIGSAAMPIPPVYLWLNSATRRRLTSSEKYYDRILSRELLTISPGVTIGGSFTSMVYGLDARGPLPPFSPVLRGEDSLFGFMLPRCFPGLHHAHVPAAVLHSPLEKRSYSRSSFTVRPRDGNLNIILIKYLYSAVYGRDRSSAGGGLKALGRSLAELGGMPPQDFEREMIDSHNSYLRIAMILKLEAKLKGAGDTRPRWVRDAAAHIAAEEAALEDRENYIWSGFPADQTAQQRARRLQNMVRRLGELFTWWPEIQEAARELRAAGLRPAREL